MDLRNYVVDPAPDEFFYSDLASDFIEEVVGSERFSLNWSSKKPETWLSEIERWLRLRAIKADAREILSSIKTTASKIGSKRWMNQSVVAN